MSTINIKLRDLLSKEQIENFNTLTNKILCCGNDAIVLEVEEDILKEAGAKSLHVTKIIKLKKREENDANCRILSQALTRIRELCGTKFVLENEDVLHITEIIDGAKSAIKQTRN